MANVTYRQTREGQWVAFGPAAIVQAGNAVTVTKRDGTVKLENVVRVGNPFVVDGVAMVYGYLAPAQRPQYARPAGRRGCPLCGSRGCAKAFDPRDLCDED